jgi:hypothetical protein
VNFVYFPKSLIFFLTNFLYTTTLRHCTLQLSTCLSFSNFSKKFNTFFSPMYFFNSCSIIFVSFILFKFYTIKIKTFFLALSSSVNLSLDVNLVSKISLSSIYFLRLLWSGGYYLCKALFFWTVVIS